MKVIKYKFPVGGSDAEPILSDVELGWNETNEAIAGREAYRGEYTVEEDGSYPAAPKNILAGEYVTVEGVLYLATENIPWGEPVVAGQNAIETTLEQQLCEMKGE